MDADIHIPGIRVQSFVIWSLIDETYSRDAYWNLWLDYLTHTAKRSSRGIGETKHLTSIW